LVYLDQSTRSRLAGGEAPRLLDILKRGVEADRLVCPESSAHDDETMLAHDALYAGLHELGEKLSMGIEFHHEERHIEQLEVEAAVESFLGAQPRLQVWQQAFNKDPHTPLEDLFDITVGGGARVRVRVSVGMNRAGFLVEEAERPKSLVPQLTTIFENARASGASYEEIAEQEYHGARESQQLGPLFYPLRYEALLRSLAEEDAADLRSGADRLATGSAYNRFSWQVKRWQFRERIIQQYPDILQRKQDFYHSEELRAVPMLRYPALIVAALELTPGRKAKPGDVYDLKHLTLGLSRCDVVTADGAMVQACEQFYLIPDGVRLFRGNDVDGLATHLGSFLEKDAAPTESPQPEP
jgi:hypothetical protein